MRQYQEVNNYYLCEKVQLRPTSLLHYSYVMDLRNYEVGYTPTLRQNLNKEKTELDELNALDDISEFGSIVKYAEKCVELYKEKQQEVYNEKGHVLKDLGTLSDTQVRNIKKYAILFADATKSNKDKYLSFVTLTLPSAQIHHDRVLRKILAKYLDHLKKVYGLKNYLWKAETQKNGNIHFHVLIDTQIPRGDIQRIWNQYINKYGYVDRYSEKMNRLTAKEYMAKYSKNYKSEKDCILAYQRNKKMGWSNPPSTKIETPKSKRNIVAYVVKYLLKQEENKRPVIGAVWGASNKVKKLNYLNFEVSSYLEELNHLRSKLEYVPTAIQFVELYKGKVYQMIRKGYKKLNEHLKIYNKAIRQLLDTDLSINLDQLIQLIYEKQYTELANN
ncbi:hypothetical protein RAN97_03735 [Ornithobacterium rhinotracheale]|uniref:rolling circle replication-associated protein n=1 Tax=Ornithobacterium rhinotracheale TaxID=28251 RepID=UPI003873CCAF